MRKIVGEGDAGLPLSSYTNTSEELYEVFHLPPGHPHHIPCHAALSYLQSLTNSLCYRLLFIYARPEKVLPRCKAVSNSNRWARYIGSVVPTIFVRGWLDNPIQPLQGRSVYRLVCAHCRAVSSGKSAAIFSYYFKYIHISSGSALGHEIKVHPIAWVNENGRAI